jgi:hypothetical protein
MIRDLCRNSSSVTARFFEEAIRSPNPSPGRKSDGCSQDSVMDVLQSAWLGARTSASESVELSHVSHTSGSSSCTEDAQRILCTPF